MASTRVCIIGAGLHGFTAAEACLDQELDFEIYEMREPIDSDGEVSTSGSDSALSGSGGDELSPAQTDSRQRHRDLASCECLSRTQFRHKVVSVRKGPNYKKDGLWTIKVQNLAAEDEDEQHSVGSFHVVLDCTKRYGIPLISFPALDEQVGARVIGAYRAQSKLKRIDDTVLEVGHLQAGSVTIDLSKANKTETSIEMGQQQAEATGGSSNTLHADWIKYVEDLGKLVDKTLSVSETLDRRALLPNGGGASDSFTERLAPASTTVQVPGCEQNHSKLTREMLKYIECDPKLLDKHDDSEVAAFYAGRSVFLTGVSGFIGKTILEKLLRSCPNIGSIFLLMRPKRGKQVSERLKVLFESALFDRLRGLNYGPGQIAKVHAIEGDITKPLFGVSGADMELLAANISVIIHSAASVKFIDPLKTLIQNNIVSLDHLIQLASRLDKLEALVHVSTAYGNCDKKHIDEIIYDQPLDPDFVLELANTMTAENLEKMSTCLLNGRPNKYTYTKAMGESLLEKRCPALIPNVPVAIVRPSITAGCWREPIPGWIDNYNASTGVVVAMATGALQVILADANLCADVVPVDVVANMTICSAFQVHHQHHQRQPIRSLRRNGNISVFNCVSGRLHPVTWGQFNKYMDPLVLKYPTDKLLRTPEFFFFSSEPIFRVYNFFNHKLFAYGYDYVARLMGKNLKLVEKYKLMMMMMDVLKPFTLSEWQFECGNVSSMYEWLSPVDKELFNFDIRQVDWRDYFQRYLIGTKIFLLKDKPEQVEANARSFHRRMWYVQLVQVFLMFTLGFAVFSIFL